MGANFAKLSERLNEKEQQGIQLISISVDPQNDTPERLRKWRAKFGTGLGWTLLTGERRDVNTILKALNSYSADITSHSPNVLVGNEAQDRWTRANGLADPATLEAIIRKFAVKPQ